jgi:hypothetical protein
MKIYQTPKSEPETVAQRPASSDRMRRLVRCSSFCWLGGVGVIKRSAPDISQKLLGYVVSFLAVWIGVAMPVSGLGVVSNQIISGREESLTLPRQTETVETPNSVQKLEVYWIKDAEGLGVRVIKILAYAEEDNSQMAGCDLSLVPPSNTPSGSDANHGTYQSAKNNGDGDHMLWWYWLLVVMIGLVAVPFFGIPLLCEACNLWEMIRASSGFHSSTNVKGHARRTGKVEFN